MSAATIGWAAMGKPDFSQAAKLFYRLPAEIREQCNRSEEKVLIWSLFLTWTTAFRSGRGTGIASFSETWLGAKFMRSRWTVLRALAKLESFGLVKRIRRSPRKDGTYQTNLLALGARLTALLSSAKAQPREKTPCSKTAPQEVENVYKREKVAVPSVPAPHSLSLSACQLRERNEGEAGVAEKQVEKGTLTRLFHDILNKNRNRGGKTDGLST